MSTSFKNIITTICVGSCLVSAVSATPVINEIMYRPGSGYPENTALEFIEIHNPDSVAVDISGWSITKGPSFTFPSGTSIPAGGYVVVAADPTSLMSSNGISSAFGPWKTGSKLSDKGETITLSKPGSGSSTWTAVDSVTYADEGDWATRTRDSLGGWSWVTNANGGNCSLERINPSLSVNNGQNWGASKTVGGTPGAANSLKSSNIAPVITAVKHSPAVPSSSDPITISCSLADESDASSLSATLYWRDATSTSPGSFQSTAMTGNSSGVFSATLSPFANKAIVEFYVSASDGKLTRTWPAASSEGQNTNCTFQVDNESVSGTAPVYRLVLTAAENAAYASLASSNPNSDRQFNTTLVVTSGTSTTIRYRVSMRIRGFSSRSYTYKPLRISLPTDDRWDDVTDFALNPKYPWLQFLGMRLFRAAGLHANDAIPIELRRNGVEYVSGSSGSPDYGRWVRVSDLNGDLADKFWPDAVDAQVYRAASESMGTGTALTTSTTTTSASDVTVTAGPGGTTGGTTPGGTTPGGTTPGGTGGGTTSNVNFWKSTGTAPTNPDTSWNEWSKQNASGANDWSDVMNFTKVWQSVAASHFTGASDGSVQTGTWNNVAFTDAEVATLSTVADLDQMARWLAVMTIMLNNEPNLSTGSDDDYAAAFVNDGTNKRLYLLPHDLDTVLGKGDTTSSYNSVGLFDVTETDTVSRAGSGTYSLFKPLLPLLGNSTTAGNASFRQKYFTAIRELFGSVFDADTSTSSSPAYHAFIDAHLGDWLPASVRTEMKTFMTNRQKYLLGLIGAEKIVPATATSTATASASSTPSLRINEVLAVNSKIANGSSYPDIIELYNAGSAAVDLSGKSLSDDSATPTKYVFPSGTSISAGGFLVIYADTDTSASGLHTGFSLDAEGDQVLLYDTTTSGGALIDSIKFGWQIANYSIGRTPSAPGTWALMTPSFGAANGTATSLGSISSVKLNEWAARADYRLDEDYCELANTASQPVALTGARLTDDINNKPSRFAFPSLSFIAPNGFCYMPSSDIGFSLNADFDYLFFTGENGTIIDQVDFIGQPADSSTGRATDGTGAWTSFTVPSPGISNQTTLPTSYQALLDGLRITEIMYAPVAAASSGDYEYIELTNIGLAVLDLGGVRFTNGLDYTFPSGTTLNAGARIVVCKNRTAFLSRYPSASASLAPNQFSGALDNSGETIALTLPDPWNVNILKFRYESTWYPLTKSSGYALVVRDAANTAAKDWDESSTWSASEAVNGNPGSNDSGSFSVTTNVASGVIAASAGQTSTLKVTASSSGTCTYQWQILSNGSWVNISGATSATYALASTQEGDAGTYRCVVTASGNSVASDAITVTVDATTNSSARLLNLSTRAMTLTGDNVLIPGFIIEGSGTKQLLLRVVGPRLADFGVTGTLSDPQVTLKKMTNGTYVDIASNDNWSSASNASTIVTVATNAGAFALTSGSKDASLLVNLAPGQFSAVSSGVNSVTGVALVEFYDTDSSSTSTTKLTNLSTRGYVGTDNDAMFSGFVISSEGARTLLIRAVGPTLTSLGVSGALSDPVLTLYRRNDSTSSDDVILTNDNWSSASNASKIASTAATLGAFSLASGSKDAVILATLQPGIYSVKASGAGTATGVALLEIYVVP